MEDHPFKGAEILREKGYDESFVKAVLSHASHTNVPRDTQLEKTLFAVDELCGMITAVALVRPSIDKIAQKDHFSSQVAIYAIPQSVSKPF
mgnify:CR=1 FL=1